MRRRDEDSGPTLVGGVGQEGRPDCFLHYSSDIGVDIVQVGQESKSTRYNSLDSM